MTCPELPETSYRSVWSILGSCALTLVICLWHALHVDVPQPGKEGVWISIQHVLFAIWGFLAPEFVIGTATKQWVVARKGVIYFREQGYEWSMRHSYFAESGGFVYCDREGIMKVIKAEEFLWLCEAGKIDRPLLTENEIKDRSKSDAVSKAIFTLQLLWFVLQLAVRHFDGLVVTLVELDTLCMAVLAVFYLLLWWSKPLSAGCPHIFYESSEAKVHSHEELSKAWSSQPSFLCKLLWHTRRAQSTNDEEKPFLAAKEVCCLIRIPKAALNKAIHNTDPTVAFLVALLVASSVLGALHLTAWNYAFPTKKEKIIWRAAALGLTGGLIVGAISLPLLLKIGAYIDWAVNVLILSAVVCRAMLAILMILSLRALPCSAHQIVSWVQYIPHL